MVATKYLNASSYLYDTYFLTGTLSPVEIIMTVVVGMASLTGIVAGFITKSGVLGLKAAVIYVPVFVLQVAALRISFLSAIAHR